MVAHVSIVGSVKKTTKITVHRWAYRYNGHYVSEIKTKEIHGSFQIYREIRHLKTTMRNFQDVSPFNSVNVHIYKD